MSKGGKYLIVACEEILENAAIILLPSCRPIFQIDLHVFVLCTHLDFFARLKSRPSHGETCITGLPRKHSRMRDCNCKRRDFRSRRRTVQVFEAKAALGRKSATSSIGRPSAVRKFNFVITRPQTRKRRIGSCRTSRANPRFGHSRTRPVHRPSKRDFHKRARGTTLFRVANPVLLSYPTPRVTTASRRSSPASPYPLLPFAYNLVSWLHNNRAWPRSKRDFSESLHTARTRYRVLRIRSSAVSASGGNMCTDTITRFYCARLARWNAVGEHREL